MLLEKTALVTGASGGIGRGIAEEFAKQGADIVVNYHSNLEGGIATRDAIRETGQQSIAVKADVSDEADAIRLVDRARAEFGEVNILVNNAGVFPRLSWNEMTRDDWDWVLDVNLGGLFNMSQQILPSMAERGEGAAINISSTWALIGGLNNGAYTASKGGIVAVTRQMCHEYASAGVRVNAISPGATATAMNEELREDNEYIDNVKTEVPAGRFGHPEDIAHVAAFLASDKAAYVHGQNIVVDGGLTV